MDASLLRRRHVSTLDDPARAPAIGTRRPGGAPTWVVALVALAVAGGVALRFLTRSQLWLDEALSVNIAKVPLGQLPNALRHDGSPPLYYLLLKGWMAVFGSGDVAVRALSGLLSVAALPLMWIAGRRTGGRVAAWIAVLLLAASPFAIRYGTEARMYSLLGLLALLGYLAMRRLLERPSWPPALAVAVLSGAMLLTHYWALYFVATVFGVLALRYRMRRDRGSRFGMAAVAAGALFLLPWLSLFVYQVRHTGTPWAGRPPFAAVIDTVRAWSGGFSPSGQTLALVLIGLATLAIFGAAADRYRIELDLRTRPGVRSLALACFGTLTVALVAGEIVASAFVVRYTILVFPYFLLVAAFGTLAFGSDAVRGAVVALAVVLGFIAAVPNTGTHRTQAPVVARVLNRSANAGDVVGYCPDQLGPAVSRLVTAPVAQLTFPLGGRPERVDWVDYASRNHAGRPAAFARFLAERAGSHVIWVVWAPGYRTYKSKCEGLVSEVGKLRPDMKRVVKVSVHYEERMGLVRYRPG